MSTSPGPLLEALTTLWAQVRSHVADLPTARIAISPTPPTTNHDPTRWAWEGEVVTGLVVSAETLQAGPDAVLEVILHEAAHVLCWARGVQDTASHGAYHNGRFLAAAEEVGLSWPADQPRTGRGYATPSPTEKTLDRYRSSLAELEDAIPLVLPHLTIPDATARRRPASRLTLRCGCNEPRKMQMSPTVAAKAPVVCGACKKPFTAQ
ncbi:hypothetical protein Sfulv_55380 [Streptomyces fulvorobeus]|uniref:SprT-like domain-containing protein n=1 Tax=Streptomyces fulvorobeus TaxID=284028 RepID=A0A7J0CEP2_9ACTN|nr:hypothetical protein Sfulv_55380 [Streptomyces fulvorobeus]